MSSAPSLPFLKRLRKHPAARGNARGSPSAGSSESVRPIEIVAPDRFSTAMLLEYAAPVFPAEVVPGSAWIVRLQPPAAEGKWVVELLSLVQRWLESTRLPCANVLYGGRSYLIRSSTDFGSPSTSAPATGPMH